MFEQGESRRKQRPVTVLTLLFGLLLGISGGGGAQLQVDPNRARLGNGEILRAASLRTSNRSDDDRPDERLATGLVPPAPQVVTRLVSIRPAATRGDAVVPVAATDRHLAYRARAPPIA